MPTTPRRRPRRPPGYATSAARRLREARPRRKSGLVRAAEALWGSSWIVRQALAALALFLVVFAVLRGTSPLLGGLQDQIRYYLTADYDIRGAARQVMSSNLQERLADGLRFFPEWWDRLTGRNRGEDGLPEDLALILPVTGGTITSSFGYRADPVTGEQTFHAGIDIAAPEGTPIVAAAPGVVLSVEEDESYGKMVEIDHGGGVVTLYAHAREITAAEGALVKAGDTIGTVGMTGRATSPHCHFEVIVSGQAVDPLTMPGLREGD